MKIINEDPKQKSDIKTMKVKGRKSKLTTELIEKISTEIENGSYQKVAVRKCGLGESSFFAYLDGKSRMWSRRRISGINGGSKKC